MYGVYGGCKEGTRCVITTSGRREVDAVYPANETFSFVWIFLLSPVKKIFMTFLLMDRDQLAGIDFLDASSSVSQHFFCSFDCMNNLRA